MKKNMLLLLALSMMLMNVGCGSPKETMQPAPTTQAAVSSEAVVFADPTLEAMVRATMGKPEGDITAQEAAAVTSLNLGVEWSRYASDAVPIRDISGLEYFTNLESLDLSYHAISDISPLAGLKKLAFLSLSGNPIADLTPLSDLTNLKGLMLSGCTAQDYSQLSALVNLKLLSLEQATLADVSPLATLTNLKYLYLAGCPISNYFPLSEVYQNLEQKDFTIAFTLAELGFVMNDEGKIAALNSAGANVQINHIEWGIPQEDWIKDCIVIGLNLNDYTISIGYEPKNDVYFMMADKVGMPSIGYAYDHANDSFIMGDWDRDSLEPRVRDVFTDTDEEDVLLTPAHFFRDTITQTFGISADTLFELPFDEADDSLPSPFEKLGFTLLDFKGTYEYEEKTPHQLNISIHKQELDQNVPQENRVNWSMAFTDSDVNGYGLQILYFEGEGNYFISIEKDGVQAGFETRATGERGWESPDMDTVQRMFNDAFGTKDKEFYDAPVAYFERVVQERFGMSFAKLYALPAKK